MFPDPSTPYGYGGYSPSGGYPPQPGGPCATTSTHAAPPMWRNVDEDFDRVAKEMADANNQWKRLDDHPQLMDPSNKPPDSNGNPYIPGAAMFVSTTINAGTMFIGEHTMWPAGQQTHFNCSGHFQGAPRGSLGPQETTKR